MLQSQAGGDLKNIVSELEIYEWDAVTELRRDEGHDDPETDGLVDVEGQHLSGSAIQLQGGAQGDRIIFESRFNKEPLEVQTSRVSSLYFRQTPQAPGGQAPVEISLTGGGSLQCSSLEMNDSAIIAMHPLLGKLTLDRSTLKRLAIEGSENNGS